MRNQFRVVVPRNFRSWGVRHLPSGVEDRHNVAVETARFDAAAARVAEDRGDFDTAIALVGPFGECFSDDLDRHEAHLWHVDLLGRAGRTAELAEMGRTDEHARRRLNRLLYRKGRTAALRRRALAGDKLAFYLLVGLHYARGRHAEARRAIMEIDPTGRYAIEAPPAVTEPSRQPPPTARRTP